MGWSDNEEQDPTIYKVVVNHEEQYSIWPAHRESPLGWRDVGRTGTKAECLAYIKEVWTDMRPLSLRKDMEEAAQRRAQEPRATGDLAPANEPEGKNLVARLSEGEHPVELSLRPMRTVEAFRDRIAMGYVHIKFTDTRGGTELGVRLDPEALDLSQADFERGTGTVRLEGRLTLDFTPVRCVTDIDLQTLVGKGHLIPVAEGRAVEGGLRRVV